MWTAGSSRTVREHSAPCNERNAIVWIIKQLEVDTYFTQHFGRVCTQVPENLGYAHGGTYAHGPR